MKADARALLLPTVLLPALLTACGGGPSGPDMGGDPSGDLTLTRVWEDQRPNQTFTVLADRVGRPFFYVVSRDAGLLVYEASNPDAPTLVHTISGDAFTGRYTNNLAQDGNLLYVATGNFQGLPEQTPGLAIVDVSDPAAASIVDHWSLGTGTRGAHAVEVRGGLAYLAGSWSGLIVLDVSDPGAIAFVSQFLPDPDFPRPNPGLFQTPAVRGLAFVSDDLLLLTYDAGGLRTIDVSDPAHPSQLGQYVNPEIDPDVQAQAFNNVVVEGTTAYVTVDYCGVDVFDVSDPATPALLAWWNPWECDGDALSWFSSPGHTNELVLRPEQDRLFVSAGDTELAVLDISNPEAPILEATYGEADDGRAAWGLDATGSRVYLGEIASPGVPYFSNWSGVVVLGY